MEIDCLLSQAQDVPVTSCIRNQNKVDPKYDPGNSWNWDDDYEPGRRSKASLDKAARYEEKKRKKREKKKRKEAEGEGDGAAVVDGGDDAADDRSSLLSISSTALSSASQRAAPEEQKRRKKKRSKSQVSACSSGSSAVSSSIHSFKYDTDSYVSLGPPVTDDKPALFDKYFFYSNKIMKNIGRYRPPQDGVRTLDRNFTLQQLIEKNGGIPEMCKAATDYSRNFRFPYDNRSGVSVDLENPATKKKPIELADTHPLGPSHLKSEYPRNFTSHFLYPLPSIAPRVFPERHVPFMKLFKEKSQIKKPKDYD